MRQGNPEAAKILKSKVMQLQTAQVAAPTESLEEQQHSLVEQQREATELRRIVSEHEYAQANGPAGMCGAFPAAQLLETRCTVV